MRTIEILCGAKTTEFVLVDYNRLNEAKYEPKRYNDLAVTVQKAIELLNYYSETSVRFINKENDKKVLDKSELETLLFCLH